jgi:hypothetical protein
MLTVRRRKLRVIPWILAAGGVASLVLVAVSWRDLLVRYHLWALRRDPAGFVSFLDAPEDTVKALALKAFVREPAGQQALVSRFIDDFHKARTDHFSRKEHQDSTEFTWALENVEKAVIGIRGASDVPESLKFWGELCWAESEESCMFPCLPFSPRVSLFKLLSECYGARVELRRYPGLTMEVLSLDALAKRWTPTPAGQDPQFPPQDCALLLSKAR